MRRKRPDDKGKERKHIKKNSVEIFDLCCCPSTWLKPPYVECQLWQTDSERNGSPHFDKLCAAGCAFLFCLPFCGYLLLCFFGYCLSTITSLRDQNYYYFLVVVVVVLLLVEPPTAAELARRALSCKGCVGVGLLLWFSDCYCSKLI